MQLGKKARRLPDKIGALALFARGRLHAGASARLDTLKQPGHISPQGAHDLQPLQVLLDLLECIILSVKDTYMDAQEVMHMNDYNKITALYSRLSVGDEDRDGGESNSIQNQELICKGWFLPPNTYDCGSFVVN